VQLLIVICAASAGVHAVLAPAHFQESPSLGVGFAVAAVALAAFAIGLDRWPQSRSAVHAAAVLLGALLIAYAATRITAVPLLGDHREPIDAIGVATKLIEAVGLLLAIKPINEPVVASKLAVTAEKGALS
jgi:drug/metabolite transporter (DMT)-like permease